MLKIKISSPDKHSIYDISQYVGNSEATVDGCQFFINDPTVTKADYWICSEDLNENKEYCYVDPQKVYFVSAEAAWPKLHYHNLKKIDFLKQFAKIFTCHPIYLSTVIPSLPFLPWMINSNHGPSIFESNTRDINYLRGLGKIDKPNIISVFCSNQKLTEDHKLRIKFVTELKKHFGNRLHWYGNGIKSLPTKWEGIAPYKYHIVLENQSTNNVITEKLYDAYLGLAYPIYYGAPNVTSYFESSGLAQIDIYDLNGSIRKIEEILLEDSYQRALPEIIKAKDKVLDEFNLFKRFAKICNEDATLHRYTPLQNAEKVELSRSNRFTVFSDLRAVRRDRGFKAMMAKMSLYYSGRYLRHIGDRIAKKYEE